MKKLVLSVATVALAATVACDLGKTSNQIQAKKVMVATILATPEVDIDPIAMAGWDGGGFDAGTFDGGITFDGGTLHIPPQTVAFVWFGTRVGESLDTPP